jgi:hypothetical protein
MSQAIHYHDVQWPYGPHGLKPQCNGLPGMWAHQAIHYHNFLWPHRTQGLKLQPHKILKWIAWAHGLAWGLGSYVAN